MRHGAFSASLDNLAHLRLERCTVSHFSVAAFNTQFKGKAARLDVIQTSVTGRYLWFNQDRPVVLFRNASLSVAYTEACPYSTSPAVL